MNRKHTSTTVQKLVFFGTNSACRWKNSRRAGFTPAHSKIYLPISAGLYDVAIPLRVTYSRRFWTPAKHENGLVGTATRFTSCEEPHCYVINCSAPETAMRALCCNRRLAVDVRLGTGFFQESAQARPR